MELRGFCFQVKTYVRFVKRYIYDGVKKYDIKYLIKNPFVPTIVHLFLIVDY